MPKKPATNFDYLANDPNYVPDPEIEEFMELEISHAPKDPDVLAQRLRNNTAASRAMLVATSTQTGKTLTPAVPKQSRAIIPRRISRSSKRTPRLSV
jgi:hypothetical protein